MLSDVVVKVCNLTKIYATFRVDIRRNRYAACVSLQK